MLVVTSLYLDVFVQFCSVRLMVHVADTLHHMQSIFLFLPSIGTKYSKRKHFIVHPSEWIATNQSLSSIVNKRFHTPK